MRILKHIAVVVVVIALLYGPFVFNAQYWKELAENIDIISSATEKHNELTEGYVVLINKDHYPDEKALFSLLEFFSGNEDTKVIPEKISCVVSEADQDGVDTARYFQDHLSEQRMHVWKEDVAMVMSKAYYKNFDVILVSEKVYETYAEEMSGSSQFDNIALLVSEDI